MFTACFDFSVAFIIRPDLVVIDSLRAGLEVRFGGGVSLTVLRSLTGDVIRMRDGEFSRSPGLLGLG